MIVTYQRLNVRLMVIFKFKSLVVFFLFNTFQRLFVCLISCYCSFLFLLVSILYLYFCSCCFLLSLGVFFAFQLLEQNDLVANVVL